VIAAKSHPDDTYARIAAVDFDDTLRVRTGKRKGERVEGSLAGMRWLADNGFAIVIWTASIMPDEEILGWLKDKGYPEVKGVNKELTRWETHSPKIVAHVYIDDRGVGWEGWHKAVKWLERNT